MGGTMAIQSVPGQGSTFRVTVPLGRDWDAVSRPAASELLRAVPVLVVDDNATSRAAIAAQLEAWGMLPAVAADGSSALSLVRTAAEDGHPFPLAVVDAAMPGMDGVEVARRMAEDPLTAATRVVMLATRRALDAATAGATGISAAATKPVRRAQLHDALVRALGTETAPGPVGPRTVPEPAAAPPVAAVGPTGSRGRILVVEDNTTNQLVATGLLTKLGYQPEIAGDGRQAVEAVRRHPYAAVLMDCNMPVMDGYEATTAIRSEERGGRHVPIVAMTAGAMAGDRDRCLTVGMDDYVAKPVKLADLERALTRWAGTGDVVDRSDAGQPGGAGEPDGAGGPGGAIDGDQLRSLWALDGGDGRFLSSLVESFFASSDAALPALAAAAELGDAAALTDGAHRLRGEAATLGATGLADLCRQLEAMTSPLDRAAGAGLVARAAAEMRLIRARLETALHDAHVSP
jgi:CheY-like chemotaxis protein/HPt (histidine-containing phosphotransfer) domain-containing protein